VNASQEVSKVTEDILGALDHPDRAS
jgi:hypothetical protein